MPNDDLIQHVYAYFLKAYNEGVVSASGSELVAFEPIGFSPGCTTAPAAFQEVSQLADVLPLVDGGVYTHTLRTLSVQYSLMVEEAQPSSATTIQVFSDMKSQAGKLFKDAMSDGELDGPKATFATPVDWYDLQNAGNWNTYRYDSAVRIGETPPATPQAPNVHLVWRVVETVASPPPVIQRPAEMRAVGATTFVAPSPRPVMAGGFMAARPAMALSAAAQVQMVSTTSRLAVTQLAAQTVPRPVEAETFALSFDYCLVRLRRPWLSGDFLFMPGWYVPGAHSGDYSTGTPANKGWFAAIPIAFIAIKNLVISGSWSMNDVTHAGNSAAFGPFSLIGISASQTGVLSNPGVQIIAWVCDPQPKLPPNSDPSAAAPTTPAS